MLRVLTTFKECTGKGKRKRGREGKRGEGRKGRLRMYNPRGKKQNARECENG